MAHSIRNLLRDRITALHIRAHHLHINRSRQAEIQNLSDNVRGLKEKLHAGKLPGQRITQLPRQISCRLMARECPSVPVRYKIPTECAIHAQSSTPYDDPMKTYILTRDRCRVCTLHVMGEQFRM